MGGFVRVIDQRFEKLMEELVRTGRLPDVEKARTRFRLGYPSWLVLEDLGEIEAVAVLAMESGIPALEGSLTVERVGIDAAPQMDPGVLKARRWVPLADGRVAVADPFKPLPEGDHPLAGLPLALAPGRKIDEVLTAAFPGEDDEGLNARRLGRLLLDEDMITEEELARALDEQRKTGGKLGDILIAQGTVNTLTKTKRSFPRLRLAGQIAFVTVVPLLLPFLLYVLLYAYGIDVSTYVYIGIVLALVVTAYLIWVEGLQALNPGKPAEEPNEPYPPASAIIAAYLPNEADTIVETIEAFLRVEYPAPFRIILAYNTPEEMPVEAVLYDIADRDPRFLPLRVAKSTSKAQNVNVALSKVRGEFVGVFDADHHPDPESFCRAWRWLSGSKEENGENRYDVVQGHSVVRNGDASWVSRTVAVEFEAIYAVSHPGRTQLHAFGVFGGSNGYWKTDLLRQTKMRGFMLTEDIDSSMRVIETGYKIVSDPLLISRELAPETWKSLWNQRMRWAQGWFQVSLRHLWQGLRSSDLTFRQKLGFIHLLGWREVYPWISLQIFPIVAFWIWRGDTIDWFVPIFVLTTIFTLSVGPGQTLFAYLLAAPDIRKHKGWFLWYFVISTLFYTEFKNLISRVAQVKQFMGEQEWKVTARTSSKGPAEQGAE